MTPRNRAIVHAVRHGATCADQGRLHGISRERVRQLCERAGVRSRHTQDAQRAEWTRLAPAIERAIHRSQGSLAAAAAALGMAPARLRSGLHCHLRHLRTLARTLREERDRRRAQEIARRRERGETWPQIARALSGADHVTTREADYVNAWYMRYVRRNA